MEFVTYDNVLQTYQSKKAGMKALSDYEHWFPLHLSPRIAGIVADLMGDGHLQGGKKWRVDYTSASIDELKRFDRVINDEFEIEGKIRPCRTNIYGETFNLGINCNPFGRTMYVCGVPRGAKVLSNFRIPEWITGNKECFRSFTLRLFDCEGSVDMSSKCIELKMSKEVSLLNEGIYFFKDITSNLQKYFRIKTTNIFLGGENLRKDGRKTQEIRIKIKRKSDVIKFCKEINFESGRKRDILKQIVEEEEWGHWDNQSRGIPQ